MSVPRSTSALLESLPTHVSLEPNPEEFVQDGCKNSLVLSAEKAEECCQEMMDNLTDLARGHVQPMATSFGQWLEDSADIEGLAQIARDFEREGFTWLVSDDTPREVGWIPVAGFQGPDATPKIVIERLQPGKVTIREFNTPNANTAVARVAGAAAVLSIVVALLQGTKTATRQNVSRTGKKQKETSCCGCILEKVLNGFKRQVSAGSARPAKRRRVPLR